MEALSQPGESVSVGEPIANETMIIDGKVIAEEIVKRLKARPRPDRFFAAVLVGDDAASLNF